MADNNGKVPDTWQFVQEFHKSHFDVTTTNILEAKDVTGERNRTNQQKL